MGDDRIFKYEMNKEVSQVSNTRINLDTLREWLKRLDELPVSITETSQTLFEIAGFPRRETVYSNFLAFFFNTTGEHGLKDLFLKSLLEVYFTSNDGMLPSTAGVEVLVELEYHTKKGNFIDIVIDVDNYAVIIENKIDAELYNDLEDYFDSVEKDPKYAVVLSLNKQADELGNFTSVTYAEFLERIQQNLGSYLCDANTEWLIVLKSFIKTMQNLERSNIVMNSNSYYEILAFFADAGNVSKIKELEKAYKDVVDFMYNEVDSVRQSIESLLPGRKFGTGKSNTDLTNPWARIRHEYPKNVITKKTPNNFFEIILSAKGWEMRFDVGASGASNNKMARGILGSVEEISLKHKQLADKDESYFITLWSTEDKTIAHDRIAEEAKKLIEAIDRLFQAE